MTKKMTDERLKQINLSRKTWDAMDNEFETHKKYREIYLLCKTESVNSDLEKELKTSGKAWAKAYDELEAIWVARNKEIRKAKKKDDLNT